MALAAATHRANHAALAEVGAVRSVVALVGRASTLPEAARAACGVVLELSRKSC